MSWDQTERTLRELEQALSTASTPEQYQAAGTLATNALISLAQTVFRPEPHWRSSEALPSVTDSKRQLEAYVAVAFAGGSNDEARAYVRAAIKLADALRHKRTATLKDARLVAIATDSVIRIVALTEGHELTDSEVGWQAVQVGSRYFAWDGPTLHALDDRSPIQAPQVAIDALKAAGNAVSFGLRDRLRESQARGVFQVFETDRTSWRRELLYASDGNQVLLVRPGGAASGA